VPDSFLAGDRAGIFVDWHLHGGDPHDGRMGARDLMSRQQARGVAWPVSTHHNVAAGPGAFGVTGAEWSGPFPRKGGRWTAPHVLVLGAEAAVAAALAETDVLAAVRRAVDAGALVIVAHLWRSQGTIPDCPTFDAFVAAGVHGFETGNRHRDANDEARARLRDLDRRCRERGLPRFSFSDDHGVPPASPCVTFLEGVEEGDPDVLPRVRDGSVRVIPLLFHAGDPTFVPPRWLAPPIGAFQYFRSLRIGQRLSWFAFAALVGAWVLRPKRHRYTPR
jgi:hypothetical protein